MDYTRATSQRTAWPAGNNLWNPIIFVALFRDHRQSHAFDGSKATA
jgi:hypothetical protein